MSSANPHIGALEQQGFAQVQDLLADGLRQKLAVLFDGSLGRAGSRAGLAFETVRAAATSGAVQAVVSGVLGRGAFAIKATLFDKTSVTNWLVPWHQDVTIPVRERRATPGFEAWSSKDGIPHVRPPVRVLESMLAVRLDLDGTTEANGPLRVLPGTHKRGVLTAQEIQGLRQSQPPVNCLVPPLGGLIMRPLLLHASSRTAAPANRRIVHLEFASGDLPGGLEWCERCVLEDPVN